VPNPLDRPSGCSFHPRCREFMPGRCDRIDPARTVLPGGREVRCLLHEAVGQPESVS
jgi:peptide/nickel transport system ATP-binding protein